MKYNKLVRDNIPEYIISRGGQPVTHIASDEEYREKLREKLQEEVAEFLEAESLEELADVLEVIDALIQYQQFDRQALTAAQVAKRAERGGFEKRIILDES